jgi:hypothetical protein
MHFLQNANKYGPMETTVTLLHSAQKSTQMNTLENNYIQFFHQENIIIKKKNKK